MGWGIFVSIRFRFFYRGFPAESLKFLLHQTKGCPRLSCIFDNGFGNRFCLNFQIMAAIKIKRAYEPAEKSDGFRVLVDRLWPRGIKKEEAGLDEWLKEVAPSAELRKWFNHEPEKWPEFRKKYIVELRHSTAVEALSQHLKKHKTITLIYGAKDEKHNQAVVLKAFLENRGE